MTSIDFEYYMCVKLSIYIVTSILSTLEGGSTVCNVRMRLIHIPDWSGNRNRIFCLLHGCSVYSLD